MSLIDKIKTLEIPLGISHYTTLTECVNYTRTEIAKALNANLSLDGIIYKGSNDKVGFKILGGVKGSGSYTLKIQLVNNGSTNSPNHYVLIGNQATINYVLSFNYIVRRNRFAFGFGANKTLSVLRCFYSTATDYNDNSVQNMYLFQPYQFNGDWSGISFNMTSDTTNNISSFGSGINNTYMKTIGFNYTVSDNFSRLVLLKHVYLKDFLIADYLYLAPRIPILADSSNLAYTINNKDYLGSMSKTDNWRLATFIDITEDIDDYERYYNGERYIVSEEESVIEIETNLQFNMRQWSKQKIENSSSYNFVDAATGLNAYNEIIEIAVGGEQIYISTSKGMFWKKVNQSFTGVNFKTISYYNGIFVAAGDVGTVYTSSNGTVWTLQNTGDTNHILDIDNYNGLFVAAATNKILTSTDGIAWNVINSPIAASRVCCANGLYVVSSLATRVTAYSTDGATWNLSTASVCTSGIKDLCFDNEKIYGVGVNGSTNYLISTIDGITWSTITTLPTIPLRMDYSSGIYVILDSTYNIINSLDTLTWVSRRFNPNAIVMSNIHFGEECMVFGANSTLFRTGPAFVSSYNKNAKLMNYPTLDDINEDFKYTNPNLSGVTTIKEALDKIADIIT